MDLLFTFACAALLGVERLAYRFAWRHPVRFAAWVRRTPIPGRSDPVCALRSLFYAFKAVQIVVLVGWCMWFGATWLPLPTAPAPMLVSGVGLLLLGQALNAGVMRRLGTEGVFYGNRFGREIEWQTGWPFSVFPHPQYLGAALSVWGFMLAMRFPAADWFVLPLISSVYYALGARGER